MTERVPAAIAAVSSIIILAYACATAPTTDTETPAPSTQPVAQGHAGRHPAATVAATAHDSARRVATASLPPARQRRGE